jgi:4-aminobutyrate---pyruvate transaminase
MPVAPNSVSARDVAYVVHPQTNLKKHQEDGPTIITSGKNIYVYDDAGQEFIDGAAGLWCASLGFSNERLAKTAFDQMRTLGFYHTYRSTANDPSVALSEKLIQMAPVPMSKVLLQCSGSEANDTAIKLIWYYHAAIGKPEKNKIIGRNNAYHGTTCASISVSGKADMHADFGLPLPRFIHTEFPHYYRNAEPGESEEAFATRLADALEALILKEGPDTVGGFFAEPVMGAGGAVLPPRTYFEKIQKVLRKYDILFVADEIVCGFGRTGNMWGSETYQLEPDMISCAKALSAAMLPISGLLVNQKVFDAMVAESEKLGAFAHGFTYAGHPVSSAVALETLRIYDEIKIIDHVRSVEQRFLDGLESCLNYSIVGDARGVGLIGGVEFVESKKSRSPFKAVKAIEQAARRNGLILRFIGNRVALSPPLIVTESQIDEIFARLRASIEQAEADLKAA